MDGRYRIESRLGTGGMADVYLAEDQQLERQVALKLLHRRFAEDPGFVERFRREAQSAANLQHPHVVAVYDRGAWDGTYYIAMEYLQGRTLKQVIREEAPLDPVRAIDITLGVLKATRFAHRRGVIHRDLKPHNVMLDDQDHVKVTDFGIARAGASDMTETGSIMGTAQYLSPEQAQGLAVAESSDLYSIGVVLYELLTGRVPFDAESAVTIALKHVSEAPVAPSHFNAAIPPALEQTVLWALNKNAADRPQNADQFISVLEGIRESLLNGGNGEITASLPAVGAAGIGGAGGAAAAGALGAAGLGAAALGTAAGAGAAQGPRPRVQLGPVLEPATAAHPVTGEYPAYRPYGPEPPPPPAPPDPSGRRGWPWLVALLVALLVGGGVVAYLLTRPQKVTVPVVVNDTQAAATSRLEAEGFNPSVIQQASASRAGTVIYQSPLGGTRANSGATVDLTVSTGPGNTTVPAVVALSQKQAIEQLHLSGLKVSRIIPESSNTVPKHEATRTDPPAGTTLTTGQSVVLYISSGVAPIPVPSVTGDTLANAQSALSQFHVKVEDQTTTTAPANSVISQSPTGGANVLPGTTVTLVVARRPPRVSVPNLVGDTLTHATATLTALGLKVSSTPQSTGVRSDNHRVLAQTPGPGGKVAQGATVALTVGAYAPTNTTTSTTPTSSATTTTSTGTTTTTGGSVAPGAVTPGGSS
ncbi:MAG TPA: PASTA domain-containing protein [Solirubrobacteraceae bacterium]|nr:PASTA domain-containing protein [Solirubrobacteraceae bacterium]